MAGLTKIRGDTQITAATIPAANTDGSLIKQDGSVAYTGDQAMGTHKITGLAAPSADNDAARKVDVDAAKQGLDVKDSVRVVTVAALPAYGRVANVITETGNGALPAIDGVTLVNGERLLLKDGAAPADNGIYIVSVIGTGGTQFVLTRAIDADTSTKVTSGMFVFATEGTANSDTGWVLTTPDPITLNTTSLTFAQYSGSGSISAGAGLTKTGSTIDAIAGDASILVNADELHIQYVATAPTTAAPGDTAAPGTGVIPVRNTHVHGQPTHAIDLFAGDGGTTVFTLAATPLANTVTQVFVNGLLQDAGGGNDYTMSGANVTLLFTAETGAKIRVYSWHA